MGEKINEIGNLERQGRRSKHDNTKREESPSSLISRISNLGREDDDDENEDSEIVAFGGSDSEKEGSEKGKDASIKSNLKDLLQNKKSKYAYRNMSSEDARSLVGGQSTEEVCQVPEEEKNLKDDTTLVQKSDHDSYNHSHKIFTFTWPFGGLSSLSNLRGNFYRQMLSAKTEDYKAEKQKREQANEIGDDLKRQPSISTIDEGLIFKGVKGLPDVRAMALKHSFASNFKDLFPDLKDIIPDFLPLSTIKKEETHENIYNDMEKNVVIMGGYRGSMLRDVKTNKRLWIPYRSGFHLLRTNLLIGPTKEDELRASKETYSDGVLKNVGPVDICKRLIKKLSSNPKNNVKEFGYDWRLSGRIVTEQLVKFLEKIYKETGKPTLVLAHSMGGLIAHLAMHVNPTLFSSLIYLGCPSECLNILGPIRFGDAVFFNDKILSSETNFMMRSSFNLLPLSGRVFVDTNTFEPLDLDYFDPETWVEYNLNPLVSKARKIRSLNSATSSNDSKISKKSFRSRGHALPSQSLQNNSKMSLLLPLESARSSHSINNLGTMFRHRSMSIKKAYKNISESRSKSLCRSKSPSDSEKLPRISEKLSRDSEQLPRASELSSRDVDNTGDSLNDDAYSHDNFSILFDDAYRYLSETLKDTKDFLLSLEHREELAPEYPPLAVVYGNEVPSVSASLVDGEKDIKDGNYYNFYYGRGDGVVYSRRLMPEGRGFKKFDETTGEGEVVGKFPSSAGHVDLMTDLKSIGYAISAVLEAEKKWDLRRAKLLAKRKTSQT